MLYQLEKKLSLLLTGLETLFIIDDIIADKSLDKLRKSLLELAISGSIIIVNIIYGYYMDTW